MKISDLTEEVVERLIQNAVEIRNRLKIQSIIKNANDYVCIEASRLCFSVYIWEFVEGR